MVIFLKQFYLLFYFLVQTNLLTVVRIISGLKSKKTLLKLYWTMLNRLKDTSVQTRALEWLFFWRRKAKPSMDRQIIFRSIFRSSNTNPHFGWKALNSFSVFSFTFYSNRNQPQRHRYTPSRRNMTTCAIFSWYSFAT